MIIVVNNKSVMRIHCRNTFREFLKGVAKLVKIPACYFSLLRCTLRHVLDRGIHGMDENPVTW
jgi:hypothetical protein